MRRVLLVLLSALVFSAQAQITSTFDTDADGWTFLNSTTTLIPNHSTTGGNPAGFISVIYSANVSNPTQSWIAPAKFLGNQVVRSMDMNLRFDLQQSQAGTASNISGDVRIKIGNNIILYSLPTKPAVAPAWSSYSLKLDETQGWRVSTTTGPLATRTQIIAALSGITAIEIRGTYATNATYTSAIDNVILEQKTLATPPTITSFSPTSGTPGSSITITGSGFDPTSTNNVVYFGSVAGAITNASATQLTVTVPVGAQYEKLTIINKTTARARQSEKPFNPTFAEGGRIIPASFGTSFTLPAGSDYGAADADDFLSVGDMDGDGWTDLISTDVGNTVVIYRNLGAGGNLTAASFAPKFTLTGAGSRVATKAIDLDGDGKLDIATGYYITDPDAGFATYRNISTPGNLAFEPVEKWLGLTYSAITSNVADVDGDGRADLIGRGTPGSVAVDFWIAQNISSPGNIEFGASRSYFGNNINGLNRVVDADLDNDGKPEMIIVSGEIYIAKNNSTPGAISFDTPIQLPLTGVYGSVSVVDFNLDGKNDIAWKAGFNNDDVHIRINANSGGALSATDFATDIILNSEIFYYGGLTISDINGDGKPDIITTDNADVGVFENKYSGGLFDANSFGPAHQLQGIGVTTYPKTPLVADLNGDKKQELILYHTNIGPGTDLIAIYENKNVHAPEISINTVSPLAAPVGATLTITGDYFSTVPTENIVRVGGVRATVLTATKTQLSVSVPAGATYGLVSVTRDLLTAEYRLPFKTTFSPGVTFNNTHFSPPVSFTLTTADYDVEVGDLNNDGKPEVIAEGLSFRAYIFRNTHTSGTISTSSLLADDTTSTPTPNPRLIDIDGDGYLDINSNNGLFKNITTTSEVNFTTVVTPVITGSNHSFGDYNLDGKTDILGASGGVIIAENRTSSTGLFSIGAFGSFSTNITYAKPAAGGGTATADFDNDGWMDFVATNPTTDNISTWKNSGSYRINNTQFTVLPVIATGDNPGRIYAGDLDSDGKMDLVLYHGTGTTTTLLTIFHNTSSVGNISFNRIDLTNPSPTTVAHIADLDGDGRPEIITTSEAGNRFSIFKNIHTTGALTAASFAAPFNTTVTAPRGLATGDLNLDGKPEIIITRAAGFLVVYENLITPPTISSFTPASGPIGTTVTITGTNFSAITSNNTVTFNGVAATVTASAATSITVTVPLGATTGSIAVTVAGITATSATNFTVTTVSLPTIISFAPPAGIIGASVTITGTNFSTTPANNTVMFNGTTAIVTASTATSITTTVPTGATTGTITVAVAGNTATSATNFTVTTAALPTITSFNPTSGTVSASVIITGTNFSTAPANNTVKFNGTTAPVTASTATSITTTVPAGATSGKITVTVAGNTATSTNDFTVTVPVGNPPVINTATTSTIIGGIASIPLTPLLSDPDNNLDLSTLKIIVQPTSGALATIDANKNLKIDYTGNLFAGTDELTIEVCDLTANCVQKIISIEVSGEIVIYNGISPNTDGKNDAWIIKNIAALPETRDNKVTIFNRWGSKVFEVENYNNDDRVFKGLNDNGNELPSGTYFYKILFSSGREAETGYLTMKR